jgi:hypothetical protein
MYRTFGGKHAVEFCLPAAVRRHPGAVVCRTEIPVQLLIHGTLEAVIAPSQ